MSEQIKYTYEHNYAAWLGAEIVTVPDQIANIDALIAALDGTDFDVMSLPNNAQHYHDSERTVFPVRRRDGRIVNVRLDGKAYGLWTPGTGDMIVREV